MELYARNQTASILGQFKATDSPEMDIYRLSDDVKVVSADPGTQIDGAGAFEYQYQPQPAADTFYFWTMIAGAAKQKGLIGFIKDPNLLGLTVPLIAGFGPGDSVTVDIYRLSDGVKIVTAQACSEVDGAGTFKYLYTPAPSSAERYLYVMNNGSYSKKAVVRVGCFPQMEASVTGYECGIQTQPVGISLGRISQVGIKNQSPGVELTAHSISVQLPDAPGITLNEGSLGGVVLTYGYLLDDYIFDGYIMDGYIP